MKGVGANPRILFDRKYIILPIVPLGCVSKTAFKILNDGYENLNLNYLIDNKVDDVELIIKLESDQLGVTK